MWGLVDGDVGVGGCFRLPDESVGLKMGLLYFPGERRFGYEFPPGVRFWITGIFNCGKRGSPIFKRDESMGMLLDTMVLYWEGGNWAWCPP